MLKTKTYSIMIAIAASIGFTAVNAENTSISAVVDKHTCSRMANTVEPFILVLSAGDNLRDTISQCAKDAKLLGASVSGLGQLHNPTLAYFTSDPKAKPTLTTLQGYYELAGLNGNVAVNGDKFYTHVHAVLADEKFHGIAGHVDNATVGLTVEVTMIPFTSPVERSLDAETGFGPLIVK